MPISQSHFPRAVLSLMHRLCLLSVIVPEGQLVYSKKTLKHRIKHGADGDERVFVSVCLHLGQLEQVLQEPGPGKGGEPFISRQIYF